MVKFTSIFDVIDDEDELRELKARLADAVIEASDAETRSHAGNLAFYAMKHDLIDLHREARRVQWSRRMAA